MLHSKSLEVLVGETVDPAVGDAAHVDLGVILQEERSLVDDGARSKPVDHELVAFKLGVDLDDAFLQQSNALYCVLIASLLEG